MPTLFRLLVVIALIVAFAYGVMIALVTFVHPGQREISQTITLPKPSR